MVQPTQHTISPQLNDQQREAVLTTEGPLLIIAGPGSGKTFTLVERICYLIAGQHVAPEQIMVTTFTDKAARELITRISERLREEKLEVNVNDMRIGTLHSICLRLLEEYREYTTLQRHFTVMEQFEQQLFLYQRLDEYRQIPAHEAVLIKEWQKNATRWRAASNLMGWLNTVSEEALDVEQLKAASEPQVRALGEMYTLYRRQMAEENALDFSTIQVETLRLLENNPHVLAELQEQIRYVLFDEYQDTNFIQEAIVMKLAGKYQNICVVGDDDQGLYRFRGATIRNILEFPSHFANGSCKIVRLTTNYRSHPDIIRFYNRWMQSKNWELGGRMFRYPKQIQPRTDTFSDTPSVIKVIGKKGRGNWAEEVYAFLIHLKETNVLTDWNQVAFLFRSVRYPDVQRLAKYLEDRAIPVYAPRANQFFNREEVRLMMGAMLSLFPQYAQVRQWDPMIDLEIWGQYDTYTAEFAREMKKTEHHALAAWIRQKAHEHETLSERTTYAFSTLFYELIQFPLFARYIDCETVGGVRESRAARNLARFSRLLTRFEDLHHMKILNPATLDGRLRQFFNEYFRFLIEDGVEEYEDEAEYAPSGCVSFLTIHQSKGMEFPVVIVGSLEASPFGPLEALEVLLQKKYYRRPLYEPFGLTTAFDFWRLYYTAFSRAQHLLVLSGQEREGKPGVWPMPSDEFLPEYQEIPLWRNPAFQADQLKLGPVREVKLKKEYSFSSHLHRYESCPRQYLFDQELNFSPIRTGDFMFGTLVHNTIEDIHKAVLRGERHKITDQQISQWLDENYQYLSKKEYVTLRPETKENALNQVKHYVIRHQHDWSSVAAVETAVVLTQERYILNGRLDLVRTHGDTLEIVDFKSQKKPQTIDEMRMYRRQLEIYAYLLEQQTGQEVSRLHLYYTGETEAPYVTFEKNRSAIEGTIAEVERTIAKIEAKQFALNERPLSLCRSCDFRFYCAYASRPC